jgi:hypothetical protein
MKKLRKINNIFGIYVVDLWGAPFGSKVYFGTQFRARHGAHCKRRVMPSALTSALGLWVLSTSEWPATVVSLCCARYGKLSETNFRAYSIPPAPVKWSIDSTVYV